MHTLKKAAQVGLQVVAGHVGTITRNNWLGGDTFVVEKDLQAANGDLNGSGSSVLISQCRLSFGSFVKQYVLMLRCVLS